jgi:Outer membrane cytochrome MtrC/MtrF-like, domains II/IV
MVEIPLFVGMILAAPGPSPAPTPSPSPSPAPTTPARPVPAGKSGCTEARCHKGIEAIREPSTQMFKKLVKTGARHGDPDGCVTCHGGDPRASTKKAGHLGSPSSLAKAGGPKAFYRDPGSPWINATTCGQCHPKHTATQWNSLMMTEAGKIQGTAWAFGSLTGYKHLWANYDAKNPRDPDQRLGTLAYRRYMAALRKMEPNIYVDRHHGLPDFPADVSRIAKEPHLAAFTYLRTECQRCHLGVRGRQTRGDYRGMGCSACHIPYGNEGTYEGADKTLPRNQRGRLLVHTIQSSRNSRVTINGKRYTGIPVETCTTCHDRGKRIGVSFQGLMESAFKSPWTANGKGQLKLHTKRYLAMHEDIHSTRGMLCMDCHTSKDVHGDGFLSGTTLGQVEIECSDCHGTPTKHPWDLPLGTGEEFAGANRHKDARGVATTLTGRIKQGGTYPPEDGYLLTARGNPYGNVVRRGNSVVVHTAAGKTLVIQTLKTLTQGKKLPVAGRVAMAQVASHLSKVECYTCHGTWTPQCYGCHVKIDYSKQGRSFDWVAAGRRHAQDQFRGDRGEKGYPTTVAGRVTEQRSYMRWANPMLVINGEGRVSPAAPGCQVSATVIGPDGKMILQNHIFRTTPGTEGSGKEGQLSIDMSPTQPHTTGKARTCESCHTSPKALGYGISGGRNNRAWNKRVVVDLMTADRRILPRSARTQIEPIAGLANDWARIVTEKGKQLQTVGHHWKLSRPLNNTERAHMSRTGVCLSCHQELPTASLAVSLLHHVAKYTGKLPKTAKQHDLLVNRIMVTTAWGQVIGVLFGALLFLGVAGFGTWKLVQRRRRGKRPTSKLPVKANKDDAKAKKDDLKSEPPSDKSLKDTPPAEKTPPEK